MSEKPKSATLDIVALIIAGFALLASCYSVWLTQDHYRKSVIPLLAVQHHGGRYRKIGPETEPLMGITIQNRGVGPALIAKIRFCNQRMNSNKDLDFEEFLRVTGLNRHVFIHHWRYPQKYYLRAGDTMPIILTDTEILSGMPDEVRTQNLKMIADALSTSSVVVEYESLYGETSMAYLNNCS